MNTSNSLPAQTDEYDDKNHQYQQQQHKTDNDSNEFSCVNRITFVRIHQQQLQTFSYTYIQRLMSPWSLKRYLLTYSAIEKVKWVLSNVNFHAAVHIYTSFVRVGLLGYSWDVNSTRTGSFCTGRVFKQPVGLYKYNKWPKLDDTTLFVNVAWASRVNAGTISR